MRLRLFVAAVALLSASLAARADTITESYSTGPLSVTSSEGETYTSFAFDQFNPALGTLTSASITAAGTFSLTGTTGGVDSLFQVAVSLQPGLNEIIDFLPRRRPK
jgi:hypothetical protein